MSFGDGQGQAVALPSLFQARLRSELPARERDSHCLDVGIAMPAVAAGRPRRVTAAALVEIAIAGEVVIDADDVRHTGALAEQGQLVLADPSIDQPAVEQVIGGDAPTEQVEAEPAP